MTFKKKLALTFGVLLLLFAGGVYYAARNLNRIVKSTIESMAPKVLGVSVKVGGIFLSPMLGQGSISNLEISNPPGFKGGKFMKVGKFSLGLKWGSLASSPIQIDHLKIDSPEIWWEGTLEENNVAKIQRHAEHYKKEREITAEKGRPAKQFHVGEYSITGAKAHVAFARLPDKEFHLDLPAVAGQDLNGSADQITSQILSRFGDAIRTEIQAKVLTEVKEAAKEMIRERAQEAIRNWMNRRPR